MLITQKIYYIKKPSYNIDTEEPKQTRQTYKDYIIYGDSRDGNLIHQQLIDLIIPMKPNAVFHTGDLVNSGWEQSEWDKVLPLIEQYNKHNIPFYPALGNHEENSPIFKEVFKLDTLWYKITIDKCNWIILNNHDDMNVGSPQYVWLEKELQTIPEGENIFIVMHYPIFSSGEHSGEIESTFDKKAIIQLFSKYGVDIVFSGHDHSYERSEYNGIMYIVTGGGGAPIRPEIGTNPYSKFFKKVHHFCHMRTTTDKIHLMCHDINGQIIDEVTIDRK